MSLFKKTNKTHYIQTLQLGTPIMLGQVGVIITGFVDNMMVGHHSTPELAAASFVNNFFNLAFIFGTGFAYGLTPIIGQLFSSKSHYEGGETLRNSLLANTLIALIVMAIMGILYFNIENMGQPKELIPIISPYFMLQWASLIIAFSFQSFKQFFDGITDTLAPMWIMLVSNILNIIGNYLLIFGNHGAPELGLTGAGISTLFSRIFALGIIIYILLSQKKYRRYRIGFTKGAFRRATISRLARLGIPISIQMGVESASFCLVVVMMGWISKEALAAHQIAGVITTLGFLVYYGIAAAVTIRVSIYKEQNDWNNVKNASYAGLQIIFTISVVVSLAILLLRNKLGYLFTTDSEVLEVVAILLYSVIAYQLSDGIQILFSNALRGIGDVNYMAKVCLIVHFFIALPLAYILGFTFNWGATGVWACFPISLSIVAILLWHRFHKLSSIRT